MVAMVRLPCIGYDVIALWFSFDDLLILALDLNNGTITNKGFLKFESSRKQWHLALTKASSV